MRAGVGVRIIWLLHFGKCQKRKSGQELGRARSRVA